MSSNWNSPKAFKICPVKECQSTIGPKLAMCFDHWKLVPEHLKKEVYKNYGIYVRTSKSVPYFSKIRENYFLSVRRSVVNVQEQLKYLPPKP